MKSPLWIITSALGIILVALAIFMMVSIKTLFISPKAAPLKERAVPVVAIKKDAIPQNLNLIYEEDDLFGTYQQSIKPIKPIDVLPSIPLPPREVPLQPSKKPPLQFLPPLQLKITGIIASNNESQSQVSLLNNNSLKTESLRVGSKILDAYILRIFPRKVIVIRSNGQQETLYMYSEEAKEDTSKMEDTTWADVVQRQGDTFLVNPTTFASRIYSLADFIDKLALNTASKKGVPLGIRVGNMEQTSLGYALGFIPGDIIINILDQSTTSTESRMSIFNTLATLHLGAQITVELIRQNKTVTHTYTLFNLADRSVLVEEIKPMPLHGITTKEPQRRQLPPIDRKKHDLDAMRMFGGRPEKGIK